MFNHDQCPYWCNDVELSNTIRECSLEAFEPAWQMPLTLTAVSGMKHDTADTDNITKFKATEGSSSAAAFLINAMKGVTK